VLSSEFLTGNSKLSTQYSTLIMVVATDSIYDSYAPIFDAIGQGRFGERMAGWTLRWLSVHAAPPASVLDLACGTGAAALTFAAAGCEVVGLDQSPAMLSIARGRARDAGYSIEFVEGNIRELRIENEEWRNHLTTDHSSFIIHHSSFDLVTCFYDSLNYLIDDDDLDDVFAGATAALRPGGHLLFDINTEAEYMTWDERDVVVHDGRDCLVYNKLTYDPESRLAEGRIVWFVRETDLWWRGEETHVQRAWIDDEVCGALARAGLALAGRYDVEGNAAPPHAGRIVYVAIKSPEQ
jgi:SAM-dependent methyltransferase